MQLAAEDTPTVAEIKAAKRASLQAEVKMKEANAAHKMADHAEHSLVPPRPPSLLAPARLALGD